MANCIKASGGRLDSEPVDAPRGARFFRLTDPDGFEPAVLNRSRRRAVGRKSIAGILLTWRRGLVFAIG